MRHIHINLYVPRPLVNLISIRVIIGAGAEGGMCIERVATGYKVMLSHLMLRVGDEGGFPVKTTQGCRNSIWDLGQ